MKNFILRTITCTAAIISIVFACSDESLTLPLAIAGILSLVWIAIFAYANGERMEEWQ